VVLREKRSTNPGKLWGEKNLEGTAKNPHPNSKVEGGRSGTKGCSEFHGKQEEVEKCRDTGEFLVRNPHDVKENSKNKAGK